MSMDNESRLNEKMRLDEDIVVADIVAKYDKESATRRTGPLLTKIVSVILVIWVLGSFGLPFRENGHCRG